MSGGRLVDLTAFWLSARNIHLELAFHTSLLG